MSITLYECPSGCSITHLEPDMLPGHCAQCDKELIPVEYERVKPDSEKGPSETLYVDDDGYVCFYDCKDMGGPGVWWTLHYRSWDAFAGDVQIYEKRGPTFPTEDELTEVAGIYEQWLKENPNAANTDKGDL